MRIPRLAPSPGVRRSLSRAHEADAAWTRLLIDAEFAAPLFVTVRSTAFRADARHLMVCCRRHAASVRRAFDRDFPPYGVIAGKVAHP